MNKLLVWTLFLSGYHSNSGSGGLLKTLHLLDTVITSIQPKTNNEIKSPAKLFDNKKSFSIVSFANTIEKNSTDTDTSKCSRWKLAKAEIENIIKNSKPIDGTTWDLSFLVLSCTKTVSVIQDDQKFKVEINAASFFWVNNGDTAVLFGDYKKSDRKYFIVPPSGGE